MTMRNERRRTVNIISESNTSTRQIAYIWKDRVLFSCKNWYLCYIEDSFISLQQSSTVIGTNGTKLKLQIHSSILIKITCLCLEKQDTVGLDRDDYFIWLLVVLCQAPWSKGSCMCVFFLSSKNSKSYKIYKHLNIINHRNPLIIIWQHRSRQ